MKKNLFILFALLFISSAVLAQKGNNQFLVGAEVGFPLGSFDNFNTGIGLVAKALLGLGEHSQIGFTTGYTAFKRSDSDENSKIKTSVLPLLASYRHRLNVLYFEPQLGYGIYTTTIKTQTGGTSMKSKNSNGGFTWAVGTGVQISALDLGVRYQAGYPGGGTVGFFGIHAAYVFRPARR
ncbi:MAG: outer membrane beta-barrel protein [Flavisolibacter sp.]|jgi:hypothetical protein|nr:outer membrane beta-barrel protein [Flavisolibacter sp.]